VPLSIQAYDILKELEEMRTTSKYVFPSVKTSSECMSTDTLTQVLKRLGFKGNIQLMDSVQRREPCWMKKSNTEPTL
jgi:integrase